MSDKIIKKFGWSGSGLAKSVALALADKAVKIERGDEISFNGRIKWCNEDCDPIADLLKAKEVIGKIGLSPGKLNIDGVREAAIVEKFFAISSGITVVAVKNLVKAIEAAQCGFIDFEDACRQLSQIVTERTPRHDVIWGDLILEDPIDKNKPGKSYDKFVPTPWSHKRK